MQPALYAAIAGLLGVMVGRYWDTRSETSRWKRDQRIRIYEQFAGSYYQLREAIRQLALLPSSGTEAETAASNALDRGAEFNQAIIAVWLHGSAPVIASAHQVEGAINALYVTARAGKLSWDEWVVRRRAAQHALHEFTQAVRAELGLPPVPITMFEVPVEVSATGTAPEDDDRA
ncbi:hypothetical protein [Actinoplanes subglobosus]|uniref:Secreted protein n=1 Tax=Actinoplanes subglobosus TaxID=1547892 RepID=A0ABV8IKS6_9ACTN